MLFLLLVALLDKVAQLIVNNSLYFFHRRTSPDVVGQPHSTFQCLENFTSSDNQTFKLFQIISHMQLVLATRSQPLRPFFPFFSTMTKSLKPSRRSTRASPSRSHSPHRACHVPALHRKTPNQNPSPAPPKSANADTSNAIVFSPIVIGPPKSSPHDDMFGRSPHCSL
jgi:hypothetical protein